MIDRKSSYTAASAWPMKLFKNLDKCISKDNKIRPIHIQLNVTNVCNFNCSFCSCANRKKSEQLSLNDIIEIMTKAKKVGCLAVTITGGGNPTLHPQINEIIQVIYDLGIKIGMVSNGSSIDKLTQESLNKIIWYRISSSDTLDLQLKPLGLNIESWVQKIQNAVELGPNIDWAFSHVLSKDPNYEILSLVISVANHNCFTHVRIVSDLFELDKVPKMEDVKHNLFESGVNDELVIYQGRKEYTHGQEKCYISLLKPVISAEGFIFPCCGSQYMYGSATKDYDGRMDYDAKDIDKLYEEQKFFFGLYCQKCYYNDYNEALKTILSEIKHGVFV